MLFPAGTYACIETLPILRYLYPHRAATIAGRKTIFSGYVKTSYAMNKTIKLNNKAFDRFIAACEQPARPLSEKLKSAAKRLDKEGFCFRKTK